MSGEQFLLGGDPGGEELAGHLKKWEYLKLAGDGRLPPTIPLSAPLIDHNFKRNGEGRVLPGLRTQGVDLSVPL